MLYLQQWIDEGNKNYYLEGNKSSLLENSNFWNFISIKRHWKMGNFKSQMEKSTKTDSQDGCTDLS